MYNKSFIYFIPQTFIKATIEIVQKGKKFMKTTEKNECLMKF